MENVFAVTAFQEPVTALADTPNVSAGELKRRLQAPAEELRVAHNALAEDHAALTGRVDGIVARSFEGEITREMLAEEVRGEIEGKAEKEALAAEISARMAVETRIAEVEAVLPQKCEVYFGTYTGNGVYPRTVSLGFTPKAVLVMNMSGQTGYSINGYEYYHGGLALAEQNSAAFQIVENGFTILSVSGNVYTNKSGTKYLFVAFR